MKETIQRDFTILIIFVVSSINCRIKNVTYENADLKLIKKAYCSQKYKMLFSLCRMVVGMLMCLTKGCKFVYCMPLVNCQTIARDCQAIAHNLFKILELKRIFMRYDLIQLISVYAEIHGEGFSMS